MTRQPATSEQRGPEPVPTLTVACFGTSVMQHLEARSSRLTDQADLPPVGSTVEVERWEHRGYVQRLHTTWQTRHPHLLINVRNHGAASATSRDIVRIVGEHAGWRGPRGATLSLLGCGINDVWRRFQGRDIEAVDLDEYTSNYRQMLGLLAAGSQRVICVGETPLGWDDTIDVGAANAFLAGYNAAASAIAAEYDVAFLDPWERFVATERLLNDVAQTSLYRDGVHLSELGDALLHDLVDIHVRDTGVIETLTPAPRSEHRKAPLPDAPLLHDAAHDSALSPP